MDDRFNGWYKKSSIRIDGDTLNKRWAGIEQCYRNLSPRPWYDVVEVFFDRAEAGDQPEQSFRKTFFELDPTFEMKKNALELRVLAGALLAHVLAKSNANENVMKTSLAIVTLAAKGVSGPPTLPDVPDLAQQWLLNRSATLRADDKMKTKLAVKADRKSLKEILLAIHDGDLPNALAKLHKISTLVGDQLATLSRHVTELETALYLSQEEVQIVWWLFGEYSNDLRVDFSKIEAPAAALVIGKELADHVRVFPGPRAAEAYLDRMLGRVKQKKKMSFAQAVETVDASWCQARAQEYQKSDAMRLCPLFCGLASRAELKDADAWKSVFSNRSGVDIDKPIAPIELALQAYHEFLLLRSVEATKK